MAVNQFPAVEKWFSDGHVHAYFSPYDAMGGEGSLRRWAAMEPPMAGIDRVHLNPRGYAELGNVMSKLLLEGVVR